MNLKCVVVDDEPLAITILEGYLKKIPYVEIIGKFDNAIPVYEFLRQNPVDLIFLDIEMPNISGIDFLKSLPIIPSVIFTTANKNYAIDGFDLNVEDYILKPITFERLLKSVNRVYENLNPEVNANKESNEYLYLKENKKMVKVYFKNILYIESIKDYVKIVTTCKTVITKQQLNYFETILENKKFLRIHRSFIVSTNKIDAYSLSGIDIGNNELPIGRKYKEDVIKELEKLNHIKNS